MSVGIEDADFNRYVLVPFNLEVMKLSAYYKKKGEIVTLAPGFIPDRHQLFFYRKDYDDGSYPPDLTKYDNVQYGGYAFSNNLYVPMAPEVERMHPDSSIYSRVEQTIMNMKHQDKKKIFRNMMEAEHCRLSLDNKTVWEDFEKQFLFLPSCRNLMLHDYDLGKIKDSFSTVKYILSKARTDGWATKVGMKFPIQVYNGQDLLDWSSLNSNSTFYSVQYNGVIDDEIFLKWIGQCRQRAVYSKMDYVVTNGNYTEQEFVQTMLPKLLRQIIIARNFRIFFSLKFDEDFFKEKMWCEVIRLFNFYMNSEKGLKTSSYIEKIYYDTMFDFAKHTQVVLDKKYAFGMTVDQVRSVFLFVRENNYPLFKDFYECNAQNLGGII